MKIVGFIINPISGMGGKVGLKGTDGKDTLRSAINLGAEPVAPIRAREALMALKGVKNSFKLVTYPFEMGEYEAIECDFKPFVIGSIERGETTAIDTKKAVHEMIDLGADIIVFVGGDGTARDIFDVVDREIPILGIPSGVKVHSAVFAYKPEIAARILIRFLWDELPLKEVEIMDVDEEAFREGRISAKLFGYALTPYEPELFQGMKMATPTTELEIYNQAAIATYIIEEMKPHIIYIIGPGTTTRTIGDLLDEDKTLLGVDIFKNKKIIAKDVNENQLLVNLKDSKSKIIVTPIGGQGFIFGRGNQQISPKIIRLVGIENIIVISTKQKLRNLKSLKVDTGDTELDNHFSGYIRVVTDYREERVIRIT
jgi:predicted polyphosphate/ATP-dependent NAD kinase